MIETTVTVDISQLYDSEKIDNLITEVLNDLLDPELRQNVSSRAARREMLRKFGNKAFLYPYKLKFPVINPNTGQYDQTLVYAARVRIRQCARRNPRYADLLDLADDLYKKINGNITVLIKVNSSKETILIDFLDLIEILN